MDTASSHVARRSFHLYEIQLLEGSICLKGRQNTLHVFILLTEPLCLCLCPCLSPHLSLSLSLSVCLSDSPISHLVTSEFDRILCNVGETLKSVGRPRFLQKKQNKTKTTNNQTTNQHQQIRTPTNRYWRQRKLKLMKVSEV